VAAAASPSASALATSARGVIFDKDGTLFDLDARWLPYFRGFVIGVADRCGDPSLVPLLSSILGVADVGLLPDRPAAIDTGAHIVELVVAALVGRGGDSDASRALVTAAAAAAQLGVLTPLGDVASALHGLAAGGRRLAIATSDGRPNTIAELEQFGWLGMFGTMRCGDDSGPVKPDPLVLSGIAEEWDLSPREVLYVGDNRHDLATARAAGVPFVAVRKPAQEPWAVDFGDAQVLSVDELVG
jgi:phosphoglycolate phosphatase